MCIVDLIVVYLVVNVVFWAVGRLCIGFFRHLDSVGWWTMALGVLYFVMSTNRRAASPWQIMIGGIFIGLMILLLSAGLFDRPKWFSRRTKE